jgi:hypothetical protein
MAGEITLTVRKAIQHPGGLYVVQDPASRRYLPYPGRSPYSILFLAKEQYDAICREVEHREIQQILDSVGTMIHEFPEMSFDGRSIKAPADYASADADKLDHALIEA